MYSLTSKSIVSKEQDEIYEMYLREIEGTEIWVNFSVDSCFLVLFTFFFPADFRLPIVWKRKAFLCSAKLLLQCPLSSLGSYIKYCRRLYNVSDIQAYFTQVFGAKNSSLLFWAVVQLIELHNDVGCVAIPKWLPMIALRARFHWFK